MNIRDWFRKRSVLEKAVVRLRDRLKALGAPMAQPAPEDRLAVLQWIRWLGAPRENYFWRNGFIRARWLHPTKGWRDERRETWPVVDEKGKPVLGELTEGDCNDLLENWRRGRNKFRRTA